MPFAHCVHWIVIEKNVGFIFWCWSKRKYYTFYYASLSMPAWQLSLILQFSESLFSFKITSVVASPRLGALQQKPLKIENVWQQFFIK